MWTLAWSVVALYITYSNTKFKDWQKKLLILLICLITFSADFSSIAVMSILYMYKYRGNLNKRMISMMFWLLIYALVSFIFVNKLYGILILFSALSYEVLKLYDGTRGKNKTMKWFFYMYYPLHLLIIGILRILIYGNVTILFI